MTVTVLILLPLALGAGTRSYVSLLFPVLLFSLALWGYTTRGEPSGDEVDAIPGVLLVLSALSFPACLAGVRLGRRRVPRRD